VYDIPEEIFKLIKPMTMTESASLFIERFGLNGTPESVAQEMNQIMDQHYYKDIPLKDGVKEYLDKLGKEDKTMCVASATAIPLVEGCLSRLGILDYFSFVLSCETNGRGKDHPDIYLEAAEKMGAKPEDIAVYEDALYAAETAKKAGFYLIGVFDENSEKKFDRLKEIADEVILQW
ncbi:MAG: HAD family phosphatase, partial [Eubacterium sp.]|nr:HAD family phosphatase [Eubacterium sp.]